MRDEAVARVRLPVSLQSVILRTHTRILSLIKHHMDRKRFRYCSGSGVGMATGIAIGVAIGAAMHNIAIGICLGVAIGAAFETRNRKKPPKGARKNRPAD